MIALRDVSAPLSFCVVALLLGGCGVSSPSTTTTTGATNASFLAGNWLLAGTMPPGYGVTSTGLSITGTFDVAGSTVTGVVQILVPCATIGAVGGPVPVQGTVAADGSFTITNELVPGIVTQSLTLKGSLPSVAGGQWSGTFSTTNSATACGGTTSGLVAATSVPLVSGSYTGMSALGNPLTSLLQGVTVKLALQQGGTVGTSQVSNLPLSGTITVGNSTCITSGTTTGAPIAGFVEGAQIGAVFTMNDGSSVLLDGQVTSLTGSPLSAILITTNPGTCGLSFGSSSPILLSH